MVTYTVKKGDTLWAIAKKYLGAGSRWKEIAKLNGISTSTSKPVIHVGDILKIDTDGTSTEPTPNVSNKAVIEYFGLEAGTERVAAFWSWDREKTENYEFEWDYYAERWYVGTHSTTEDKESTYSAPSNATKVRFRVKPISEKETKNKKETSVWTAEWSTYKEYNFSNNPPSVPPAPNVEIVNNILTATLSNLDVNAKNIEFQVVRDDEKIFRTGGAAITTNSASFSCTVVAGSEYKVRCRSYNTTSDKSEWSEYSSNVGTEPSAPTEFKACRAESETSVYLVWPSVSNADTYDIEYTTEKKYFDYYSSEQIDSKTGIEHFYCIITGLETGHEYFFRVRAVNSNGESSWSKISSVILGEKPESPTTWSSTTTCITGEPLTLYWVHNSEDGSVQMAAQVEVIINGVTNTYIIDTSKEEEDEKTMFYVIDTSPYNEGTKIRWRVRTKGIVADYSDWSIQRTVDVYATPTLSLGVTDMNDIYLDKLESFPFHIYGVAGPNTQTPITYHVSIIANESYSTVDYTGNNTVINAGTEVYSKHFDISTNLSTVISANDIDLENNIEYTVKCIVSMNSGLTAESSHTFTVAWEDTYYSPNAEIGINMDNLTAMIRPHCENEYGTIVDGVSLSVYRREFDGKFTELATGLRNSANTFITDPHPALDYARYRIVAITDATGAVSYTDLPGYPVGETSIVIQWDEKWTSFSAYNGDALVDNSWAGSMLKLPYNVDISESNDIDVSLVEYIGRTNPVSYYGTQLGESSSWTAAIDKNDKETIYALRRLARWMGDVYVREPSGHGYWANVSVSFSKKHLDTTIPVNLSITRVTGGA